MTCVRCAAETPAGARYCPACGAALGARCVACGRDNVPGDRVCVGCGQPLLSPVPSRFESPAAYTPVALAGRMRAAAPRLSGERKQITVLFADIRGSTELLVGRDPEEARAILDPVLEMMIDAVHRYDGTVNQVLGDGIMALFGAPLAHEDHAVRACHAAARIQEAVAQDGGAIGVRVGLNSGEVVVRSIGSDLKLDYTAVGETTHLAARLEQLARPGAVLLSDATARLALGFVDLTPLGPTVVRGRAEPVVAHELVRLRTPRSRLDLAAARGLTPFVAREVEIAVIDAALDDARRGRGRAVLLLGDAGVGKSRVLFELAARVRGAARILESTATPFGRGVPFAPFVSLVETRLGIPAGSDATVARARVHAAVPPRLRSAALTLLGQPVDDADWLGADPETRRRRMLEMFRHVLLADAAAEPTVVVVEDLHWLDPESEWVLDSLAGDLAGSRLLLLTSARPEYRAPWAGREGCVELRLEPLAVDGSAELVRHLLGARAAATPFGATLARRAAGNPFFLEETVRHLAEMGRLTGERGAYAPVAIDAPLDVPDTVHAVLAARIDRLPARDKDVLQVAAVFGTDVPVALLAAVVELDAAALDASLATLEARELILAGRGECRFRHALTQEVALAGMLRERRRRFDAAIVDHIDAMAPWERAGHLDRLVHHAVRGERWDRAVVAAGDAGERALERSALRAAAAYFERALDALGHLADGDARRRQAVDLRLALRNALSPLGESRRLLETLEAADRDARAIGDARRAGLVAAFLANYFTVRRVDFDRAIEHGRRALAAGADAADDDVLILARAFLGLAYYGRGDFDEAIALCGENARVLRGDRALQRAGMALLPAVYSRTVLAWSLAERGDFPRGLELAAEAVAIANKADHVWSRVFADHAVGVVHLRRGEADEAIAALEHGATLARDHELDGILIEVAGPLASAYVLAGRTADALTLLDDAVARAVELRHRFGHWLRAAGMAEALLASGRADEALPLGHLAAEMTRAVGSRGLEAWAWHLTAEAALAAGELEPAGNALTTAFDLATRLAMRPLAARCLLTRGRLATRAGDAERARALLTEAANEFARIGMRRWQIAAMAASAESTASEPD